MKELDECVCVQGEECVLMTVIAGEALALVRDLQDSQVVDLCMSVLRDLFQEQVSLSYRLHHYHDPNVC